jgi:hypothetical protein
MGNVVKPFSFLTDRGGKNPRAFYLKSNAGGIECQGPILDAGGNIELRGYG